MYVGLADGSIVKISTQGKKIVTKGKGLILGLM